jgi:rod shape-determining protein MreC
MKKATILSLETLELSQLEAENQRLRKILDFRDRAQINLTVALIQSRSGGPVYTSMVINRGINDGIRESMPVVSPDGFVGKIRSVFANSAIVELLADPEMAVSVYGRKSRTLGVARWSYSEGYIVEDVPVRSGLKVGEILLTTGYGGAFPRGISVGVVSEIVSGESEMYLKVKFNPSADLCNLEEVMIVETKMPVTPLSAFSPSGQSFVAGPSDSIGAGWPEMVR